MVLQRDIITGVHKFVNVRNRVTLDHSSSNCFARTLEFCRFNSERGVSSSPFLEVWYRTQSLIHKLLSITLFSRLDFLKELFVCANVLDSFTYDNSTHKIWKLLENLLIYLEFHRGRFPQMQWIDNDITSKNCYKLSSP